MRTDDAELDSCAKITYSIVEKIQIHFMEEFVMSKQFIGGFVVGAIAGGYVVYNKLYRYLAEMVLNSKDEQTTTEDKKE